MPTEILWFCLSVAASLCGPPGSEDRAPGDSAPSPFEPWTLRAGFALGGGPGFRAFGGREEHDLLLGNLSFGAVAAAIPLGESPFRLSAELGAEAFGAARVAPDSGTLGGLVGVLRCGLASKIPWVPFVEGAFGLAATDIRGRDLSTTFEFTYQLGAGFYYFLSERLALTAEYRWIHVSNADMEKPNNGLNAHLVLGGLSWFF